MRLSQNEQDSIKWHLRKKLSDKWVKEGKPCEDAFNKAIADHLAEKQTKLPIKLRRLLAEKKAAQEQREILRKRIVDIEGLLYAAGLDEFGNVKKNEKFYEELPAKLKVQKLALERIKAEYTDDVLNDIMMKIMLSDNKTAMAVLAEHGINL